MDIFGPPPSFVTLYARLLDRHKLTCSAHSYHTNRPDVIASNWYVFIISTIVEVAYSLAVNACHCSPINLVFFAIVGEYR